MWKKWERGRDFRIGFENEFWVVVFVVVIERRYRLAKVKCGS